LFFLELHHFASVQKIIVNTAPAMIALPPTWYLGFWLCRKKYGVNQWLTLLTQLAIAISGALFVRGRGTTVVSYESCKLSPRNGLDTCI
jgi:hypothetical protein